MRLKPFGKDSFIIQGTPGIRGWEMKNPLSKPPEQYKHFTSEIRFSRREKLIRTLARQHAVRPGAVLDEKKCGCWWTISSPATSTISHPVAILPTSSLKKTTSKNYLAGSNGFFFRPSHRIYLRYNCRLLFLACVNWVEDTCTLMNLLSAWL